MNAKFPDGPTRNPTPTRRAKSLIKLKPDGPTPISPAPVRDAQTHSRAHACEKLSHVTRELRVGPSGACIRAGFTCRVTRRVTRRAVGRVLFITHTPKKSKGEGNGLASHLAELAMSKPLRVAMPTVARWIDDLRAVWGADQIDPAIRAGMNGQPTFYAAENGQQIGSRPSPAPENIISLADCHLGPMNPANAPQTARKGNRHG